MHSLYRTERVLANLTCDTLPHVLSLPHTVHLGTFRGFPSQQPSSLTQMEDPSPEVLPLRHTVPMEPVHLLGGRCRLGGAVTLPRRKEWGSGSLIKQQGVAGVLLRRLTSFLVEGHKSKALIKEVAGLQVEASVEEAAEVLREALDFRPSLSLPEVRASYQTPTAVDFLFCPLCM